METPAAHPAQHDQEVETHLLFGVGDYTFALPLPAVRAVERPGRFTAVPFAAPWLRGVTAIQGSVVSVVDLGRFAGLEASGSSPGARLLVTSAGNVTAALLVDRVGKLAALPVHPASGALPDGPGGSDPLAEWWRGAHSVDGEVVPVLDAARLLTAPALHACQRTEPDQRR